MSWSWGIIITITIILTWMWYFLLYHPSFGEVHYEQLRELRKFKTGDMILFHALNNVNAMFFGSYYGHLGIVWVDPCADTYTPYLFEAAGTTDMPILQHHNANGIFLTPLENRIRKYKGYVFYKELERPIPESICDNFRHFINYAHKNMSYNYNVFSSCLQNKCGIKQFDMGTNCAEISILSLIKLGVLPISLLDDPPFLALSWICGLSEMEKNRYLTPVYVIDHPF